MGVISEQLTQQPPRGRNPWLAGLKITSHRSLAWLVDWALVAVFASGWSAWAIPWWVGRKDDLPWPMLGVLPWALAFAPVALALALRLGGDLGRGRRSLGMALIGLGVEDPQGGIPHRSRMLLRRLAALMSWITFGLGFLPALFGKRLALHDRWSGTRVVRRAPARIGWALLLIAAGPLSGWGAVRWLTHNSGGEVLRWGYLDRSGKVVIEPRFEAAQAFQKGRALVRHRGEWYWLDELGRLGARLGTFETCLLQVEGVAIFQDRRIRTTCLDITGEQVAQEMGEVFPPREFGAPFGYRDLQGRATFCGPHGSPQATQTFEEVWPFQEGLGRFKLGGKVGALDAEGRVVIQPEFDEIEFFHQGLAPARLGPHWGLLTREGQWAVEPRFDELGSLNTKGPDLVAAKLDGRWGYIRRDGTWVIPARFDLAKGFTEGGWARVKLGDRWGVIDAHGLWVLEPRYEEVAPPVEAPFAFRQGLHWGYIATTGRVVVAPMFSQAGSFKHGSAFAKGLHRWFLVKALGPLEPLPLDWALDSDRPEEGERIPFSRPEWRRP